MLKVVSLWQHLGRLAVWLVKWTDIARLLAVAVLVVYLPALVVIALAVAMTSTGPAFVRRCYRRANGQMVDLWEFRTECWSRWEPTPLGLGLRWTNMHRLPALINVIGGDIEVGERIRSANS